MSAKISLILTHIFTYILLPSITYLILFIAFTYPLITFFPTHILGDLSDAYQNIWNLWWFRKAVVDPNIALWHTSMLYHPDGVSLYLHALSPLHGFLAYPLSHYMGWPQVYNTLIIFNYIATGTAMFWLTHRYTEAYIPSLLSGMFVTFSAYHFYHSRGHMEMAALQWLILAILSIIHMLDKPTMGRVLTASALFSLTFFNTPYHALYAGIASIIISMHALIQPKITRALVLKTLIVWSIYTLIPLTPLLLEYRSASQHDLVGTHNPAQYSAEVLHFFSKPKGWLGEITHEWWPDILENPEDQVVPKPPIAARIAISVMVLAIIGYKNSSIQDKWLWLSIGITFGLLSLGPILQIHGKPLIIDGKALDISLPYAWITQAFPFLNLSGLPGRMVIMVIIAVSLLAAFGARALLAQKRNILLTFLLILWTLDTIPPKVIPSPTGIPKVAKTLKTLPKGALLDRTNKQAFALFLQIHHQKPLIDGGISRVPKDIFNKSASLAIGQAGHNLSTLCQEHQVKYIWTTLDIENITPIYSYQDQNLYDLKPEEKCIL